MPHELVQRSRSNPTPDEIEIFRALLPSVHFHREHLERERVTIFVPLSGRAAAWHTHLRPFLEGQSWPRDLVRLVLADTSQDDGFGAMVRAWLEGSGYADARYYTHAVGRAGLAHLPRPNDGGVEVNAAMRAIYGRMAAELTTRYVLICEDDHKPPPNTVERLLRGFDAKTAAVSGLYRGREPLGHWVCWSPRQNEVKPAPGPAIPVAGSGFGTVMLRRDPWLLGETFQHHGPEAFPYDIGFCQRVTSRGGVWKAARDILVEHAGAPDITAEHWGAAETRPPYREHVEARTEPDRWLAPLRGVDPHRRPWEGSCNRRPWQYRVTAVIPHVDRPELLAAVVETLRAQSERPYILAVDCGSTDAHRDAVLALEAEDLEVMLLRPRAWRYTSEPVTCAMDMAFARCETELLYGTHVDVFLKRPDYLEWLASQCDAQTPVVGYQMSPRKGTEGWRTVTSHTASMYHMPTARKLGVTWSLQRAVEMLGMLPDDVGNGWPDTETAPALVYAAAGVGVRWADDSMSDGPSVLMVGTEPNDPYEDANLVHVRSATSMGLYWPGQAATREEMLVREIAASHARVAEWRAGAPRQAIEIPPPRPAPTGSELLVQYRELDAAIAERGCRGCKTGCGNAECNEGRGDQAGGSIASIVHCRRCIAEPT